MKHILALTREQAMAVLSGRKTAMRYPVTPQPAEGCVWSAERAAFVSGTRRAPYDPPYGRAGELLFVQEPLACEGGVAVYAAGRAPVLRDGEPAGWRWKAMRLPASQMPEWAGRLYLFVTALRAERLCEISEADALGEGVCSLTSFLAAWDVRHAKSGMGAATNPWVWVYQFVPYASDTAATPAAGFSLARFPAAAASLPAAS